MIAPEARGATEVRAVGRGRGRPAPRTGSGRQALNLPSETGDSGSPAPAATFVASRRRASAGRRWRHRHLAGAAPPRAPLHSHDARGHASAREGGSSPTAPCRRRDPGSTATTPRGRPGFRDRSRRSAVEGTSRAAPPRDPRARPGGLRASRPPTRPVQPAPQREARPSRRQTPPPAAARRFGGGATRRRADAHRADQVSSTQTSVGSWRRRSRRRVPPGSSMTSGARG